MRLAESSGTEILGPISYITRTTRSAKTFHGRGVAMTGPSSLEHLRTAKRTAALTPQHEQGCDLVLIGIASVRIPEEQ